MTDRPARPAFPPTEVRPVSEVLHGTAVVDPYRWLEAGDSEETRRWTAAQNAFTRSRLDAFPGRARLRARLESLLSIGTIGTPTPARGRYFYLLREGAQNQPVLYVREGVQGDDRVLVDPNRLNPAGTTALDWYYPSDDGRFLAYGLSEDGSEASVLHLLEVGSGRALADRIPHTRAADLAWLPDASAFYYTRYPAPGTVPEGDEHYHRSVWLHRLGDDPAHDRLVFRPAEKEHWPGVGLSPDGRWLVVIVARTFDQTDIYLADTAGEQALSPVVQDLPALFEAQVAHDRLFIRTNLDAATYRLYQTLPTMPGREHWREIVPARPEAVLEGVVVARDHLVLSYLERAVSRLRVCGLDGGDQQEIPLPAHGSLGGIGAEPEGTEAFLGFSSYIVPPTIYRLDLASGELGLWRRVETDIASERYETRQVRFRSHDGTPVTMFLVHRKGLERDGRRPVYLTGYGGFNISMTPAFSRSLFLWLEHEGVLAVPNLRGGGEYGEAWHQGGMLGQKQNSFDDFIAAAEYLVSEGYTTARHLAIAGGSNGGLLMGAALTQRPDLFRAVVIQVPLLDMLRFHRFLIARLWIPEYGSPDDPAQFAWLRAYSPYHHVREGTPYPAVLLATAESDTRVDPMHARKMTARLQAATGSAHPVLLRLETQAGHGAGKPLAKVLDELTDVWSFLFQELGLQP